MLGIKGGKITDESGRETPLRGYCIGNWLMLENVMMGFPGVEQEFRGLAARYGGAEKASRFFDRLIECYVGEDDIAFMESMGCNVVRVPFNYRHFERDQEPFRYAPDGFRHLDRLLGLCAKHKIYVILDMHACPGYQNPNWHSDNATGTQTLFRSEQDQLRLEKLWRHIADHYRDEEYIAGYDIMNEPAAIEEEDRVGLNRIYRRTAKAIREVDRHHLLFFKGNLWGRTFEGFEEPFDSLSVYSPHFYADAGLGKMQYPGFMENTIYDQSLLEQQMDARDRFTRQHGVPCWIGEFGVFTKPASEHGPDKERVLSDQLRIFNGRGHSWTVWLYKDIGWMGTVYPKPDTPWRQFVAEYITLKRKYHCDFTGELHESWDLLKLMKPFYYADFQDAYPRVRDAIQDCLSRLFSRELLERFNRELMSRSQSDLDEMAASFKLENCCVRESLKRILTENLRQGPRAARPQRRV